jgi:hypothetical protein
MYQGQGWWKGDSKSIITTEDEQVLGFVYASEFMKEIRQTMQSSRK